QVRGFLRAFQAGGLELLAEHAVDGGHRDDLLAGAGDADFLAVRAGGDLGYALDVDHRHRLADVLAGEVEHALAADAVQAHRDHRRAGLLVVARTRVDQLVAGGDDALVEDDRDRLAVRADLLAEEQLAFGRDQAAVACLVGIGIHDAAVFQGGGGAEDALGLGGVLHARQLHHHAFGTLALDDRLGHAELVDAVAQGTDVLLDRIAGDLLDFRIRHVHGQGVAL